jgi:N-acetyl-anhydromuramyl-L-alanine amidase AmpD
MAIPFKASPNFTSGGIKPIGIVLHGTLGKYDGAVNWLSTPPEKRNPISYSSAHFVIAKDGRAIQLVQMIDTAWHAGSVSNPSAFAQSVLPKSPTGYRNPNESFIGIELEWFVGDDVTPAQYDRIMEIVQQANIKNPIFIGHTDIASHKADDMEFACKVMRGRMSGSLRDAVTKIEEALAIIKTKL